VGLLTIQSGASQTARLIGMPRACRSCMSRNTLRVSPELTNPAAFVVFASPSSLTGSHVRSGTPTRAWATDRWFSVYCPTESLTVGEPTLRPSA
jgi:hypothetical protein